MRRPGSTALADPARCGSAPEIAGDSVAVLAIAPAAKRSAYEGLRDFHPIDLANMTRNRGSAAIDNHQAVR